MTEAPKTMLEIEGLNQYYGGSHILRDVQLSIPAGQCTALLDAMVSARQRC
jgi:ABC-type branched-subunit amino acid transport system ATPase component